MAHPSTLRVVCGVHDQKVLAWIREVSPAHFVVCHDADDEESRPHWHALLWTDKEVQNLRVQFTKKVPEVRGNKMYSFKLVEIETLHVYERYLCHANSMGDQVKIVSAQARVNDVGKYTQVWAQQQNADFWTAQDDFKKKRAGKKNKTPREHALEECRACDVKDIQGIVSILVDKYGDADKPMNVFHMRAEVRLLYWKLNKQKAVQSIAQEIMAGIQI